MDALEKHVRPYIFAPPFRRHSTTDSFDDSVNYQSHYFMQRTCKLNIFLSGNSLKNNSETPVWELIAQ